MTPPRLSLLPAAFLLIAWALPASPQQRPTRGAQLDTSPQQGIYLVFPFDNDGAGPRLDWLSEGLEELTIQRLSAASQQVYSHAGRAAELERYGLPDSAKFSHATMLRVAADLDADYVVLGRFTSDGQTLVVEARILRLNPLELLPPVRESGPLDSLMNLHAQLTWKLLARSSPAYKQTLAEFIRVQKPVRLDAFEHYVRGLLANDEDIRQKELREAVRLEPEWPAPAFALGQAAFSRRDCDGAVTWFARVPNTNARYVEAKFTTGVCRLLLGQPDKAELVFASLRDSLKDNLVSGADLPEILNDLALARARQGKIRPATVDLQRAAELDPDQDDYPFNLGLLYLRAKDPAAAAKYFQEACGREPENPEDRALLIFALQKAGKKDQAEDERNAASESLGPNALPVVTAESLDRLERVTEELDITALQLEIVSAQGAPPGTAAGATKPADSRLPLVRTGRAELAAGNLDAAESAFRSALAGQPDNAAAHRGLAEILRRQGKLDDAVKELQAALERRDSAVDRTTLARIYLEQKKTAQAREELERALKLAPNYSQAKQLLEHLQSNKPGGAAQ